MSIKSEVIARLSADVLELESDRHDLMIAMRAIVGHRGAKDEAYEKFRTHAVRLLDDIEARALDFDSDE